MVRLWISEKTVGVQKKMKKTLKKIMASALAVAMTAGMLDFSGGGSGCKGTGRA